MYRSGHPENKLILYYKKRSLFLGRSILKNILLHFWNLSCWCAAGDVVSCKVIEIDTVKNRLSLSLRDLMPDPLEQNLETMVNASEVRSDLVLKVKLNIYCILWSYKYHSTHLKWAPVILSQPIYVSVQPGNHLFPLYKTTFAVSERPAKMLGVAKFLRSIQSKTGRACRWKIWCWIHWNRIQRPWSTPLRWAPVLLFQPKDRWDIPENYLFLLSKNVFTGSKYPKKVV